MPETRTAPVRIARISTAMNEVEALHAAARRWCIEQEHRLWAQDRHWHWVGTKGIPWPHGSWVPPAAIRALSDRACVLRDILFDIEHFLPADVDSPGEAKKLLTLAADTAPDAIFGRYLRREDRLSSHGQSSPALAERARFVHYINRRTPDELTSVEPLPFRRALGTAERRDLTERLARHWEPAAGMWPPLVTGEVSDEVVAFQARHFADDLPEAVVQRLLADRNNTRVWELREFGPKYEVDTVWMEPKYTAAEGYWTGDPMDWLLYASHESSITVCGGWLAPAVKSVWPNWHDRIYMTWQYL